MDEQTLLESFKIFLQENDVIVSAFGAAAWGPALVELFFKGKEKFKIINRKIEMSVIDSKIVTIEECNENVLLLAVNVNIPDKSFFCKDISVKISYCNYDEIETSIIGRRFLHSKCCNIHRITIPNAYNFHLHREIVCDKDNIRIIAIPLENKETKRIENIDRITFKFTSNESTKKVTLSTIDMSFCNDSRFLDDFFELNTHNIIRR